ncbi:MAG: hypothetical protein WAW86_04865 [Gammaproteobacteria bacterium]
MFSSRSNIDHLVSINIAKQIIKNKLQPRLATYEARMEKPFFEQIIGYLTEDYLGERGYNRTKAFLAEMEKENIITKTADLIDLTNEERYQDGVVMPMLLQEAVLAMCNFTNQHLALIADDVRQSLRAEGSRYFSLDALSAVPRALTQIYDIIISSSDYGAKYLISLNNRLRLNYDLKVIQASDLESDSEMSNSL